MSSVVVVITVMEVVVDLVNIIWGFGISCLENIDLVSSYNFYCAILFFSLLLI